jgi:hypothetical protein
MYELAKRQMLDSDERIIALCSPMHVVHAV